MCLILLFCLLVSTVSGVHPRKYSRQSIQSRTYAARIPMKITFEGEVTAIECSPQETLLEAMERYANLEPLYSCRTGILMCCIRYAVYIMSSLSSGSCGVCAARVLNDISAVEMEDESLVESRRRAAGFVLTCAARAVKAGAVLEMNQEDAYNAT